MGGVLLMSCFSVATGDYPCQTSGLECAYCVNMEGQAMPVMT